MSVEKRRYNILCLSGGGYRGLFSAALLRNIQRGYRLGSLTNHFDLIIGTSTGGLVAAGLACGLPPEAVVKAFRVHGPKIFPSQSGLRRTYRQLTFRSQYDPTRIRSAVHKMLGETAMTDIEQLDQPLALVAVSTMQQRHRVFCSKPFADEGIAPTPIVGAVLATTAAPTYFPEHRIALDRAIDGGIAANAPVLVGLTLLRQKLALPAEKMHVLHIGTAAPAQPQSFHGEGLDAIGPVAWWRRALRSTRDLVLLTINAQEALAMEVAEAWIGDRYVYIDAPDQHRQQAELISLDNASPEATMKLEWLAEQTWLAWQDSPLLRSFFGAQQPTAAVPLPPRPSEQAHAPHAPQAHAAAVTAFRRG